MKTDRFTDIIRRKLESIRPEFTENDWTKMQASLQQATPTSTIVQHPASRSWYAQPWVPLTAAASVAALVALAAWQRSEIATLRQTVQALNTEKPAVTQSSSMNLADKVAEPTVVHQTDTVYITRYVPVPAKSAANADQVDSRGQWAEATPTDDVNRRGNSVADAPGSESLRRATAGAMGITPSSIPTEATGTTDSQLAVSRPGRTQNKRSTDQPIRSATNGVGTNRLDRDLSGTNVTSAEESSVATSGNKTQRDRLRSSTDQAGQASANGSYSETPATGLPGQPANTANESINPGESAIAANFDQLTNQPLQLTDLDWNTMMLRKASRRMRPVRTVTIGGTQAQSPASQSVAKFAPRFRIGIGGDLTARFRNTAITGELILGKHWTLGVGYGQSVRFDGDFKTEKEFNIKNYPKTFQKEYDKAVDPRFDPSVIITNISLKQEQREIPLQIGYRIPLTQSFTILPTVGTNLTLSNTERLTFDRIAKKFNGYDVSRVESSRSRPYDVFNNLTVGTAIEWQKSHWVAQAGPLATTQLVRGNNVNAYSPFNIGARVRLFYQF
ncbi:hypothetical protein [Spirosoma sp. KUDC1026]|uniref:hypothetical protein n=1 Tax=Spirosoma sp. KUDC1026 TaxID=2745947 RepID=UPI00159BC81A|nr:hypothetical protein [Spirosoma sp. KUDC1026]QKZ13169.1 hypothetical protein HU175_11195 [Spirosoma sp. KUDC1026]